jgi:ribonuclease P protein subunit POP4
VHGRQVLLENPVRESRRARESRETKERAREARVRAQQSGASSALTGRERRKGRMWTFDKGQTKCVPQSSLYWLRLMRGLRRFALFLPLHNLWRGYMSELLGLPIAPAAPSVTASYTPNSAAMHTKLVKADYHGAYLTGASACSRHWARV